MTTFNELQTLAYIDFATHIRNPLIFGGIESLDAMEAMALESVSSPFDMLAVNANIETILDKQLHKFTTDAGYAYHTMKGLYRGDLEPLVRKAYRHGHPTRELRRLYTKALNMMIQRRRLDDIYR